MKFIKFSLLCLFLLLTACETTSGSKQMKTVMNECDTGQSFDIYVSCIKNTYQTEGTRPDAPSIRAFYANLDMINEAFANSKITKVQAKSLAYDAYMKTVHADNQRNDAMSEALMMNGLTMMQQQQQQQPIRMPVQTNCVSNGNNTNCTTY